MREKYQEILMKVIYFQAQDVITWSDDVADDPFKPEDDTWY